MAGAQAHGLPYGSQHGSGKREGSADSECWSRCGSRLSHAFSSLTIACGASKLDEAATIVGNQSFRLVKVVDVGNLTMTPRLLNVICKRPRSLVLAQHEGVSFVRC